MSEKQIIANYESQIETLEERIAQLETRLASKERARQNDNIFWKLEYDKQQKMIKRQQKEIKKLKETHIQSKVELLEMVIEKTENVSNDALKDFNDKQPYYWDRLLDMFDEMLSELKANLILD